MDNLKERMEAMERAVLKLRGENRALEQRYQRSTRRARVQGVLALTALAGALLVSPGSRAAFAQDVSATVAQLLSRVTALETKTQYLSVSGGQMFIAGTNLNLTNGLGDTSLMNGKGNLILGYNRLRGAGDVRTGSHCLIVGDENNYSSTGGLVAGLHNAIQAPYASVSGGFSNTASTLTSSVSGGESNTANGISSSVSGGYQTLASGDYSSVSGGQSGVARGDYSSVSGGYQNIAAGDYSWVSAGQSNQAVGPNSSVSGGYANVAYGGWSSVSGGGSRTTRAADNWVAGALFQDH